MRAWIVPPNCTSSDQLRLIERPDPSPGPGQVLIRVRAASLNYRDQAIVIGTYFGGPVRRDMIPLSDASGEVVAVGDGVTRFKPGDRVAGTFFQQPPDGPPASAPAPLGSPLDGVLAEKIVLYEDGVVHVPDFLSFEEAACLPCAGVTAWHALFRAGRPVRSGDTVLILGTGGVSIFSLQFSRAAGARVIATSSSDEKLRRATELGASDGINYRRAPEWDKEVLRLTANQGVDCVVEVVGASTFNRSIQSLGRGGKVALIGVLGGTSGDTNPFGLMMKGGSLHGVFVGDPGMFEEMNRAIAVNRIKPVIDRVFPFEEAIAAYKHQAAGAFGKVVIAI